MTRSSNPAGGIGFFLTIVCIVVALTCSARAQYSANVVGYATVQYASGSNLVTNPLNAGNNAISNVFRGLPNGAVYYGWDSATATFRSANTYSPSTGWTDGSAVVRQPYGGFLWVPSATSVTFVGEKSAPTVAPGCFTAQATEVLSVVPELCVFCIDGDCVGAPPDNTEFCKWNAAIQELECYFYYDIFGEWVTEEFDTVTPTLAPGEAAFVRTSQSFSGRLRTGVPIGGAVAVSLRAARQTGTNLTFEIATNGELGYQLLRSTNLNSNSWATVSESITRSTNGVLQITAPLGTNAAGFYKLSTVAFPHVLLNAERTGSQFKFDFYGVSELNYTVQRSTNDGETWQTLQTIAGNNRLISVTDNGATAANGLYRLMVQAP